MCCESWTGASFQARSPRSKSVSDFCMDSLSRLPEIPLAPDSKPLCCRFVQQGAVTFREACRWVLNLPYGVNGVPRYAEIVFEEGRGTCQSKHDLIAALAREIELPVRKYVGAYRLDNAVVEGADAVLIRHGLPYVPEIHCVLQYD